MILKFSIIIQFCSLLFVNGLDHESNHIQEQQKNGISFVVVGDYGKMSNLQNANKVFDGINSLKKHAKKGSEEDFDFIITTGDNLYPVITEDPSDQELQKLKDLFKQRENINDLSIYPVRGNHEVQCNNKNVLQNLTDFPQWKMKKNYYKNEFVVGSKQEKIVLLHIDSPLLICHNIDKNNSTITALSEMNKKLIQKSCKDVEFVRDANEMMDWINNSLEQISQDQNVIWKAAVMHHPIFGLRYPDNTVFMDDFLPLLKKYNFDALINGHEHNLSHATASVDLQSPIRNKDNFTNDHDLGTCHFQTQFYQNKIKEVLSHHERIKIYNQGENIHQFTIGSGGKDLREICDQWLKRTYGNFIYANNENYGFGLIHVTDSFLSLTFKGVDDYHNLIDLYQVVIQNQKQIKFNQLVNAFLLQNI